jgi:hypothetical protein
MTKEQLTVEAVNLKAENLRLGAEVAAHRVLLAAIGELADMPKPARWDDASYHNAMEIRLGTLTVYAGSLDDVSPAIMAGVLHDRAKAVREDADRPVRYETDPGPGCICDIASADQCKVHRRAYGFPEPAPVTAGSEPDEELGTGMTDADFYERTASAS